MMMSSSSGVKGASPYVGECVGTFPPIGVYVEVPVAAVASKASDRTELGLYDECGEQVSILSL